MRENPSSSFPREEKKQALKRQLIHDLQSFMWRFEQGGYSRESMKDVLEFLEKALESEAKEIGGDIKKHLNQMIADCQSYAKGGGSPRHIVRDLDQLRQDLEK